MKHIITKITQLFCNHSYRIPQEHEDHEKRKLEISALGKNETFIFSGLHQCTKCNHEKIIHSRVWKL